MANLKLTLACWDYDRTRALFDGRVRAEGIDLDLWTTHNVGDIMERMVRQRQFDVSELGITYFLRSLELMDAPFIAIPVFPNRFFRHSAIFVNAAKGIQSPVDLAGRRVGELQRYGHDAGVWAKGALSDDFGVKASSMEHVVGGLERTGPGPDWAPLAPPADVAIHQLAPEQGLDAMLESGEIDALFTAHIPPSARRNPARVRRLFPSYRHISDHAHHRDPSGSVRAEPLDCTFTDAGLRGRQDTGHEGLQCGRYVLQCADHDPLVCVAARTESSLDGGGLLALRRC